MFARSKCGKSGVARAVIPVQIDQHHLVGTVEGTVGHRLPDPDPGDPADDIVEALEVLHVDCGVDIDAGREQLLDILPAFWMARSRNVGMRQLVDQEHGRSTPEGRIEVEFPERSAGVSDRFERKDLQPFEQGRRLAPFMGLDDPHHHIEPLLTQLSRGRQHGVGLTDPGTGAEEDFELAPSGPRLLQLGAQHQLVRIRPRIVRSTTRDHESRYSESSDSPASGPRRRAHKEFRIAPR